MLRYLISDWLGAGKIVKVDFSIFITNDLRKRIAT